MTADKSRLAADLEQARRAARTAHDRLHACQTEHQGLLSRLEASRTARRRLKAQAEELAERCRRIEQDQVASEDPLPQLERNLQANLQSRVAVEAQLGELRQNSGVVDARLRELQAERNRAEQAVNDVREGLEAVRLEREGLRVQAAHLAEQVAAAGFELEAVLAQLPEEAAESTWTERLEGLDRRIRRLGPINLAAIDEYDAQSERKAHLDAQHEDLSKALETLFQAIHKIDRVTRERFKDTFERVNAHFGELFPKVFGGGRAYLELTGNDLLDTGVSVMARPLGKRNASVNLLSGGEKALTAIALIFSIFQLNPSPVCLLDEVDAPLDDSNVSRFAELISDMSRDVQFVVVTHNKLTMEMA
ncbi:MAG: AAA family ATPase, partial [Gammaproteobacteria bacterium]|nr:AAA family ATPase [Gammaproteobacteria bacterium]